MYKIETYHTIGKFDIYDTVNKKILGFTRVGWRARDVRFLLHKKGFEGEIPAFMFTMGPIDFDKSPL